MVFKKIFQFRIEIIAQLYGTDLIIFNLMKPVDESLYRLQYKQGYHYDGGYNNG